VYRALSDETLVVRQVVFEHRKPFKVGWVSLQGLVEVRVLDERQLDVS
jgi:hypothetical protein